VSPSGMVETLRLQAKRNEAICLEEFNEITQVRIHGRT
jgi:hypothetical protein